MQRFIIVLCLTFMWIVGIISAPVASAQTSLPDPSTQTYSQCIEHLSAFGGKVCLWHCTVKGSVISCNMALQVIVNNMVKAKPLGGQELVLIDNYKIPHAMTLLSWVNGKNQLQPFATLGKGDWIWVLAKFSDGSADITSARITADTRYWGPMSWTGDVNKVD